MFFRTEKKPFIYETPMSNHLDSQFSPPGDSQEASQTTASPLSQYKRPDGIKKEKRRVEESEFRRQKLKLLEKATKDADRRITAAMRLNDIQERLAATKEQNAELRVMLQNVASCADDELREYLCARRKEIMEKIRNPRPSASNALVLTSANGTNKREDQLNDPAQTQDNNTLGTPIPSKHRQQLPLGKAGHESSQDPFREGILELSSPLAGRNPNINPYLF
ncbi:hypothetical protein PtA15_18A368 [Puccinia triticina]|nr:uncharacterized protein PtA15_18A368 [Puccinia triticina]WAQ93308.1 hypothetical protein PtA15_18A368 [Puccinia triticina]